MRRFAVLLVVTLCAACATEFPAVSRAPQVIGMLQVVAPPGWSALPDQFVPAGVDAVWTRNGTNLDSVLVFGNIRHGEGLFPDPAPYREAPRFQRDMLAPDIALLIESAFSGRLGETHAMVAVSDLQPMPGNRFRLRINHAASNGFEVRGLAYGGVNNGRMWLLVYQAASRHYFDAGLAQIEAMFATVKLQR